MRHKPPLSVTIAILILCVAFVWFQPPIEYARHTTERPKAVVAAATGFTLVESGFSGRAQPLFGIAYATRSPYQHVSFQRETFFPTRNHSVVVFPADLKSNRYVTTETLLAIDADGRTKSSRLSIVDTESGKEVASRILRVGQIEDQTGWVGDHASKFVRAVLPPPPEFRAPLRYWNQVKEQSLLTTRLLPLNDSKPFEFVAQNCPPGVEIKRHGYPGELALDTPTWRFVPISPLNGAFCSGRYVVVVSAIFPGSPVVDVLHLNGSHLGTLELGIPGNLLEQGARLGSIENGRIAGQVLTAEFRYVKARRGSGELGWSDFQGTEVQVTVPEIQ